MGWRKGRELSPLRIHSFTPRPAAGSRAPQAASALSAGAGSLGPPAAVQFRLRPGSLLPRVFRTAPSPWCRGARAPLPGTPSLPALYIPGVSASAPPGPLVTPWVPPDRPPSPHTHPRFVEVPPLGSLLAKSFSFSKVPLLPSPGLPDPTSPLGPLPLLDPAGTVPRLEGRIPSWALGVCLGWSSWEDRSGVWGPCPVHPDRPEGQI